MALGGACFSNVAIDRIRKLKVVNSAGSLTRLLGAPNTRVSFWLQVRVNGGIYRSIRTRHITAELHVSCLSRNLFRRMVSGPNGCMALIGCGLRQNSIFLAALGLS